MIGGKPHWSDNRAPQSAASRGSKGASGASARGGRGRATRSLASDPTTARAALRPVRSWPDRRSHGPQPAALRPRPRVPRLGHQSATALSLTASTARCGPGPNAAVAAQARAVRHRLGGRVCRWVRLRTVVGWRMGGGGGGARRRRVLLVCAQGGGTPTPPSEPHTAHPPPRPTDVHSSTLLGFSPGQAGGGWGAGGGSSAKAFFEYPLNIFTRCTCPSVFGWRRGVIAC